MMLSVSGSLVTWIRRTKSTQCTTRASPGIVYMHAQSPAAISWLRARYCERSRAASDRSARVRLLEATERVEVAGEITLTRADATGYAGSFDVVIAGDHVTGSFDTANCASVSEDGFGTCH
jgi:hypothetical protein